MRRKSNDETLPLPPPKGGSTLDLPLELGIAEEFFQSVEYRRKKSRIRRGAAKGALLVMACAVAGAWGIPYLRDTGTLTTSVAQRQTFTLKDGSHAELNAQTSLATDFRYGRRIVRLKQGEAFFSVVKDAAHPFFVETPTGTVQVTGTQFDVRVPNNREAEITLVEGSVSIEREALATVSLAPGQQFDTARPQVRTLSASELTNAVTWRRGEIAFDGLTLGEVAARLSLYHGKQITVAPEIAGLRPGGTLPIDNLPALLRALESALSVQVKQADDGSYRIIGQ